MKKIINGKKYDTETADCVGCYDAGYASNDFKNLEEDLYRKKTGEFFIHGRGGPMTYYARECMGGGLTSGERIMPISVLEAQKWGECHLDVAEFEEIFGEVEE